jgi:hypothetical protein
MIERVIGAFQNLGFDLTDTEIADILWLAVQMRSSQSSSVSETQQQNSASTEKTASASPQLPLEQNINSSKSINKTEANANVYPQSSQDNNETSSGLPIKVPTAQALRNKLEISRSLKPLKRRVPSRSEFILDEIATAERIAKEKLLLPVMRSAPERWLELALVIDEGTSMFLWQETIKEFKQLLERHGAFRDVRTWGLFTDKDSKVWLRPRTGNLSRQKRLHNPRELIDPNGRRLFIIITDCVSPAWYNGAVTKTLAAWASTALTTIIQVLPEWLWERSALGVAESILLRSLAPGVPNQQLIMTALDLLDESDVCNRLKIPVVTLEPESLKNWAWMVAGVGQVQTKGFLLALDGEILDVSSKSTENSNIELTAKQRLQRFRLTASPMARKLAGLLAAVPISLPVVRLIQQTMLQKSSQVHVAEVLLGGILKPLSLVNDNVDTDKIQFDFFEGVRDLLLDAVPLTESTEVLRKVSEYLAQRTGLSVDEFTAMLVNPALAVDSSSNSIFIRPFAQITAKVLRRLGGKYAELAKELEPSYQELSQDNISIQEIIKTLNDKDADVRKIAASAIDKLPPELLPDVLAIIREIQDERYRVDALVTLVDKLPPELLPDALAIIREIQNEYSSAIGLIALAEKLPPELLPEALATTGEIEDETLRIRALEKLAGKLPPELLPKALVITREIQDEYIRAIALSALADKLPELLPEALATIKEIQDEYTRADALINLADKFPELLPEALATAKAIQDEPERAEALISLAGKLPIELLLDTLTVTQQIQSEEYRADVLETLAYKLPPELLSQILADAEQIQAEKYRAQILGALADRLPPELLPQILANAEQIQSEEYRTQALGCLGHKQLNTILYYLYNELEPDIFIDFLTEFYSDFEDIEQLLSDIYYNQYLNFESFVELAIKTLKPDFDGKVYVKYDSYYSTHDEGERIVGVLNQQAVQMHLSQVSEFITETDGEALGVNLEHEQEIEMVLSILSSGEYELPDSDIEEGTVEISIEKPEIWEDSYDEYENDGDFLETVDSSEPNFSVETNEHLKDF